MLANRRQRLLCTLPLVALALLTAACGEPAEEDGSGSSSASASATETAEGTTETTAAEAFEPFTVDHAFGSTEVTERPERIVSLDFQWTDVLVALGETPAAHLVDPSLDEELPWRGDLLAGSEVLEATTELPFEAIAAAQPDLIVVTYLAPDETDYQALSDIAPTIPSINPDRVETWQDLTSLAAQVVGLPASAAEDVVADVDEQVAAVAEELPGLEGRTVAMVNYVPGDAMYVVSDPADGANILFQDLGLEISPTILEQPGADIGRVEISHERIDLLDADLLVILLNGAEPEDITGYDDLPAVQSGAVSILDLATITGLNTPSPLSIPYSLEAIRPALEAAAAA